MQDMQAYANQLYIRWFCCICFYEMCCKTCKFLNFLARLATRFFITCQRYVL